MPLYVPPAPRIAQALPGDHALKVWSYDPSLPTQTTIGVGGTLNLVRLNAGVSVAVSSVFMNVQSAGATLTNVGVAVYSAAGALLTSSVNVNGATAAAFQTIGDKIITFTSPPVVQDFYLGWWSTGTTIPGILRAVGAGGVSNVGLAAPNFRYCTANTALTNVAPATLTAQTRTVAYWIGVG